MSYDRPEVAVARSKHACATARNRRGVAFMSIACNAMRRVGWAIAASLCLASPVGARQGQPPYSLLHPERLAKAVHIIDVAPIDAAARRQADDARAQSAKPRSKRLRVADDIPLALDIARDGVAESLDDGSTLWRLAVRASGATDLRLRFARFAPPSGASLHITGSDAYYQGPYGADDAAAEGGFHSPVVPGDTATIELHVPAGVHLARGAIELAALGAGYRDLFHREGRAKRTGAGASGRCNVNIVCPLGQPYADESRALAYYEFESEGGTFICTGTLLVDVPRSFRNFLLTAAHCITSAAEANSMVVYWNYRSSECDRTTGWTLDDNQLGTQLRASRADADFTLVELDDAPDPDWNLHYAGWDATGTVPTRTIGLHHPSGDVAKVTAGPQPQTITNCIGTGNSQLTHWLTGPYNDGTTEGGSSGSGLYVPAGDASGHGRLLIGVLSGGTAACSVSSPTRPDGGVDCYGKLASAWNGPGPASRLRDWLDPDATGVLLAEGSDLKPDEVSDLPAPLANRAAAARDAHARPPVSPRPIPPPPHRSPAQAQR
jgi:hypothetical protein